MLCSKAARPRRASIWTALNPFTVTDLSAGRERREWTEAVRGTVRWQCISGLVAATVVIIWRGVMPGLAVAYGAGVGVLNALWLARRVARAAGVDPVAGQRILYLGAVLRFLGLIAALTVAHALGLHLLAVAGGLLVAQLAVFGYPAARSKIEP